MSKIKILSETLSNKIAAGEVVERPYSVIKELVENSIDAQSTKITIEIENGGKALMRVSDNGTGMSHDDALLSIERHATSKIATDEDLFSINTLGFRGEALPSIASVSSFTLETKLQDSESGVRIEIEGGKLKNVSEVGIPTGTMVTVKNLFFNIPARRKFLKSANTEMGHIIETIENIALSWHGVQFRLYHNGKEIKNWSAVSDPLDRATDILGVKDDIFKIEGSSNGLSVLGWISHPKISRQTSRGIYIYVNRRVVKDKIIRHALIEGYAGRILKGQFPQGVIFIDIPPDIVDVNVHPSKNEVRFAYPNQVHEIVVKTVSNALQNAEQPTWIKEKNPADFIDQNTEKINEPLIFEGVESYDFPSRNEFVPENFPESPLKKEEQASQFFNKDDSISHPLNPIKKVENEEFKIFQPPIWKNESADNFRVIGQFAATYIICESGEGLILVDQHAAHERILFEKLKSGLNSSSQQLLIPETFELGFKEIHILEKLIPDLRKIGFEIEPFGGNTFVLKAVPAIFGHQEARSLITGIADKLANFSSEFNLSEIDNVFDECLMLFACHGAIRANQVLSEKQMTELIKQLNSCKNPSHCPHGRPTWIKWTHQFLEKSFQRK